MVPHRATGFSPFVLLYGCEAVTPYEILFTRYKPEEQYKDDNISHVEKILKSTNELSFQIDNTV